MAQHESMDMLQAIVESREYMSVELFQMKGVREIGPLKISAVSNEEVANDTGKRERKPVLHFSNAKLGLALNTTNIKRIIKQTGSSQSDDWIGVEITLHLEDDRLFGGGRGDTIKVKPGKTVPVKSNKPSAGLPQ